MSRNAFIVTTFYLPNLRISLSGIQRYLRSNKRYKMVLTINNDNPNFTLTEEYVKQFIDVSLLDGLLILNTNENLGCFGARVKSIKATYNEFPDVKYFMFIDDDDVVLNPTFDSDNLSIRHRAVVTHRLLEVLTLIDEPVVDLTNKNIEYEEWKAGCVGNPYKLKEFIQFLDDVNDWLPQLYEIYGSKRILEPDDCIIHVMWLVWAGNTYGNYEEVQDYVDRYSYSLTLLEDRRGRYKVEEGICDLRYGLEWDGKTHYAKTYYQPIWDSLDRYMKEKLNINL